MSLVETLIKHWKERLENIHPMVFDGCENSRENFLAIVEEYRKNPHDNVRQEIEMLLGVFEMSSSGWHFQD
jgi:hypothetical protein